MSATAPPDAGWQTEWPSEPAGPGPSRKKLSEYLSGLPAMVLMFIAAALLMKTFLVQLFFIPSESMDPTLHGCAPEMKAVCGTGDRVVVNKLAYRFREPRRGEVVVFIAEKDEKKRSLLNKVTNLFTEGLGITPPDERDFIKRLIALPGETIEVTERAVYITPVGEKKKRKLVEPYAHIDGGKNLSLQEPFKVPQDMYFMMGDNRNNSSDSRTSLGPIKKQDLIGKAFIRIVPGKKLDQSFLDRVKRFGLLHEGEYPPPLGTGPLQGTAAGVMFGAGAAFAARRGARALRGPARPGR